MSDGKLLDKRYVICFVGDFCNNNPVSAMGIVYLHYYLDNNNGFLYLYLGDDKND